MTDCLTCNAPFTPTPTHPMIERAWCDDCWRTMKERMELYGYPALLPAVEAMKAEVV